MWGAARPRVLDRFATLADAVRGAIIFAGQTSGEAAPQMLAILDRDDHLVLARAATDGAVAWCHPVSAAEARAVVTEASQLRAQASSTADWQAHDLARRLRQRANLLEARLVDPL